jgi:transmembrane E3 ubiquitin-protein ligase
MPQPPPNTAGKIFGILIIFLYLYSAPDPYAGAPASNFHSPRKQYNDYLAQQRHSYDVLNNSRYGDFGPLGPPAPTWLNLTGFAAGDGYAWEGLGRVKERVKREREMVMGGGPEGTGNKGPQLALYRNVTGVVHGTWVRSPEEDKEVVGRGRERMNLTEIAQGVHWSYGVWNRNVTAKDGSLMVVLEEKGEENWGGGRSKGTEGPVSEKADDFVREVSATMTVGDESTSGDGWEMRVHGVHWPQRGALVMTTTSAKFAGIFGLPHLMTSQGDFESSQKLLTQTLDAVLKKKEKSMWIDMEDPWSSEDSMPVPHCEYVVYAQVHPIRQNYLHGLALESVKDDLSAEMNDLESELRFPNGAPTIEPPPLQLSMIIFSPDCGFMLESKGPPAYSPDVGQHLRGLKQEVFVDRIKHWSLIWGVALFGQVLLIRAQMKESSTPSTLSRISHYSVGMMLTADSLLFGCLMLLAASAPAVFPTATLAAFAVSLSLGMGVRFLADVYNVQEPERRERERERAQAAQSSQTQSSTLPSSAPVITAAGADSLPLPVTAARPTSATDTPIIIPSDQDIDAEIAEVTNAAADNPPNTQTTLRQLPTVPRATSDMATSYGQFVMIFMCFFFLTVSSASWPTGLRIAYINTLAIIYLSFWIPQVYRNVKRNCRKAFLWKFVVGQSVLRIVPFGYFYLKEDNVLFAEPRPITMLVLAGWVWVQIWVLATQEVLGPRFGLPNGWLPEAWDYHPILREDDTEGGGMPIGLVQAPGSPRLERVRTGEEKRKKVDGHTWSVDCAICMQVLEVPVLPSGEDGSGGVAGGAGGMAGILARRLYMVTPCRHAFHSACLEGWMKFRLQCPICRENLPPL